MKTKVKEENNGKNFNNMFNKATEYTALRP